MYLPKPTEGGDFTPPPAGTFPAMCYRIVDLGTQVQTWNGQEKHLHKVMLGFELKDDETIMDDGRPMTVHQRYTWSMHEKATLRRQLEAWLGRKFTDADFGEGGFDVRNLLGLGCLINIMHEEKGDRLYANVTSVTKLPKGMTAGSLINDPVFLWLAPGAFDRAVFEKLSDGLKATIGKSPEYKQLVGGRPTNGNAYAQASQPSSRRPAGSSFEEDQARWRQEQRAEPPPEDDMERWGPPATADDYLRYGDPH